MREPKQTEECDASTLLGDLILAAPAVICLRRLLRRDGRAVAFDNLRVALGDGELLLLMLATAFDEKVGGGVLVDVEPPGGSEALCGGWWWLPTNEIWHSRHGRWGSLKPDYWVEQVLRNPPGTALR